MRAVAIKIDNGGDTSAGGFILPNDRVDVVRWPATTRRPRREGSRSITAQTILANVRVLAIGQNVEEQNGKKVVTGANATLELDPEQVKLIVLAQHDGKLRNLHLALRSLADSGGPAETLLDAAGGRRERPDGHPLRRRAAGGPMSWRSFALRTALALEPRGRALWPDRARRAGAAERRRAVTRRTAPAAGPRA